MFRKGYDFYTILLLLCGLLTSSRPACDQTKKTLREGNIRQTSIFPWLGVLRVHHLPSKTNRQVTLPLCTGSECPSYREEPARNSAVARFQKDVLQYQLFLSTDDGETFKIGLTGLVLIKSKYCIANAYDVAKISKNYIKREGKAMFILKDNETWSCSVRDYMTHPEYEFSTYNTIALVELDEEFKDELIPICLAAENYNTANQLYAMGYTDEHMLLEKVVYKIQYVTHELCDEFYGRIGFKKFHETPTSYYCGFAVNNKKNYCEWENGMVLASNSSGPWVLVGLGIKGPGCAAPSRFIDLLSYLPWIQTLTEEIY